MLNAALSTCRCRKNHIEMKALTEYLQTYLERKRDKKPHETILRYKHPIAKPKDKQTTQKKQERSLEPVG
jgi:hypothetical protein